MNTCSRPSLCWRKWPLEQVRRWRQQRLRHFRCCTEKPSSRWTLWLPQWKPRKNTCHSLTPNSVNQLSWIILIRTYRSDIRIRGSGSNSADCFDIVPAVRIEPSATSTVAKTRTAWNHLLLAAFNEISVNGLLKLKYANYLKVTGLLFFLQNCHSIGTAAAKAQQEPQLPWFSTAGRQPSDR